MSTRNVQSTRTGTASVALPVAAILLLSLLQLALFPFLAGGDIEIALLFRVDSLGIVFGVSSMLTLAVVSASLLRHSGSQRVTPLLFAVAVDLLLYAYAHNMVVLAVGWALLGVGVWTILRVLFGPEKAGWSLGLSVAVPAVLLLSVAIFAVQTSFVPPAGGVSEPWHPFAVVAVVLSIVISAGGLYVYFLRRAGEHEEPGTGMTLLAFYSLAAPYMLAKMLVAASWHPVGSWLLVLSGMLVVLGSAYIGYASPTVRKAPAFITLVLGVALTGFGLASISPLAAAGAIWVLPAGMLWVAVHGWRWAEAGAVLALLPGLWMLSQAAFDTGYGVVAALLLPAYALVSMLLVAAGWGLRRSWNWLGVVPVALVTVAIVVPQVALEAVIRPVVRTMAGGVGALTTLGVDWGVGLLVRSAQGTVPAALPATGIALAVFLAAVLLYWLKQLAGRVLARSTRDVETE